MRPSSPDAAAGTAAPAGPAAPGRGPGEDTAAADDRVPDDAQRGSAVVKFTFLSVL